MGDLIRIEHPGPVRGRPARARDDRTEFHRMATDVRLRELALSDTDEGPSVLLVGNRRLRTRLVGGEIWRPVGRDAWDKPVARSPDAAAFRAWLEGDADAAKALDRSDTAHLFAGTPLVARTTVGGSLVRPHADRPDPRTVLADWREAARAALVRYVGDELAFVEGVPMARMRGPLAYYSPEGNSFRIARFPGTWTVNHEEAIGMFLRVDRVRGRARDLLRSDRDGHGSWVEATFAGIAFRRDDDLAVTAAEGIRKLAERALRRGGTVDGVTRRVLDMAALATIGFRDEEVPAAFDLIRTACVGIRADPATKPHWLPHLEAYATRVAEPILAQASADVGADAEGLAALAR